jgi:hypothetical protein
MGLPVEVNNLMMGSLGGYTVGRSLRFRSSASAYLNRTPSVAGNTQKWTWSAWIKRGLIDANYRSLLSGGSGANRLLVAFNSSYQLAFNLQGTAGEITTSAVFRDPSAWYHVVVYLDTTQATASNRAAIYVNGVQQTLTFGFNFTQNAGYNINNNVIQGIGDNSSGPSDFFDGYLAEVNFIDGQALTPSSFGAYDTNGIWQPKKYSGTYGTNGFYLPFSNTTSTTTLVQDSSGNGNNWTPNNISLTAGTTYDSMIDSPTVSASASNYAVLNPLTGQQSTLQEANLSMTYSSGGGTQIRIASFGISTGKWYWESRNAYSSGVQDPYFGVINSANNSTQQTVNPDGSSNAWAITPRTDTNVVSKTNGATRTQIFTGVASADIYMTAIDADAGKIWFGKNGVWAESGVPETATNPQWSNLNTPPYYPLFRGSGSVVSATIYANFGQRPFSYTPPTGFNALNTYNLPAPSIANGAQYMAATTYTGNNSTNTINNGNNTTNATSFQPDMVWIKSRSSATNHMLDDSVRGVGKDLFTNLTSAESTTNIITSFNSNGFTLGPDGGGAGNGNALTYVAWQWKGGGTGVTNTSGTITSTVSANPSAGFSIVTYTGTGANATVGHGLGIAPSMVIVKQRSGVNAWPVYHSSLVSATNYVLLNQTDASNPAATVWNSTAPTSSVFSIGTAVGVNTSGQTYVAYCFSAVSGYSAFGSYTGNGSANGPFVYTGFRPRFILVKDSSALQNWRLFDSSRSTYNAVLEGLFPNLSNAESSAETGPDFLSNGFKIRTSSNTHNASGNTIIYAAFAENPFNTSRAR